MRSAWNVTVYLNLKAPCIASSVGAMTQPRTPVTALCETPTRARVRPAIVTNSPAAEPVDQP